MSSEQAGRVLREPQHVYLHVPFCSRRCSYCDFAISVRRNVPVLEYLTALDLELSFRFANTPKSTVATIYLGGGTPSKLGGAGVARSIALIGQHFPPGQDAEITVEANPEDVSASVISEWVAAGVNRLSIGAQTFHEPALRWMHRTHDAAATIRAVDVARRGGIDNISLDLIFGLPSAQSRNLSNDIERLLNLTPSHISIYGLTVEASAALGKWVERGETAERSEEGFEAEFLLTHDRLASAGFEHYEVSNYARPGHRSRHNSAYWAAVPYVGLGPSAHGFDGVTRRWNVRNYQAWHDALTAGRDSLEGSEILSAESTLTESIYLGLRTDLGLKAEAGDAPIFEQWLRAGWIEWIDASRIRCTPLGWMRLDALAAALTHHRSR